MNTLYSRVEVDGNDGVGKSTLVRGLQSIGFANVKDRGRLTQATDDRTVGPEPGVLYILLTAPVAECRKRLQRAGKDLDERYHTVQDLSLYHDRFLEVAPLFNAHVLDVREESLTLFRLERVVHLILGRALRVGVPKGRLNNFEWPIEILPPSERVLRSTTRSFDIFRLRSKAIPDMVAHGLLDVGVTGLDSLQESAAVDQLEVCGSKLQPNVRMVIAAADPKILYQPLNRPLVVATSYPRLAEQYLGRLGRPFILLDMPGCVEGLCPALVDLIIDIAETGETLQANGLVLIQELFELTTVAVRRKL